MHIVTKCAVASAVALAVSQTLYAGTGPYFTPISSGEIVDVADGTKVANVDENGNPDGTYTAIMSVDERTKPWVAPAGVKMRNLMSLEEVENAVDGQSVVRVNAGGNSSMIDMLAYDPTGKYIFLPHETPFGAGVSRYDVENDRTEILFMGDETGNAGFVANTDFGAFDPARWTPNGTVIAGEEWSGTGRLVELCNPLDPAPSNPVAGGGELKEGNCETDPNADWRVLDNLPLSAQEGITFSELKRNRNKVMYFVDEDRSGSIYKTVFTNRGKYNNGATTYVLSVNSYKKCVDNGVCDPTQRWDDAATNNRIERTGRATWVPITKSTGAPLPGIQDPRENILDANGEVVDAGLAGRIAADQVDGTPFGRPEDTTRSRIRIRKYGPKVEGIFFTATSENAVYVIKETKRGPLVQIAANGDTVTNKGFKPTNGVLNAPDNLAVDSLGNIFIIEDSPNTRSIGAPGGDIWFMRDTNNDGIAESLDHFLSLQVSGSEATGMIFNPVDGSKFVVAVQHPASTDLSDDDNLLAVTTEDGDGKRSAPGFGDAVWEFDLSHVAPPDCDTPHVRFETDNNRAWVHACSDQTDFNAVKQLKRKERPGDFPTP